MMPSSFINRIVASQLATGRRPVHHHNFGTSAHVMHLKEKPEMYHAVVSSFLGVARKPKKS
jgi:hypothetical protein